MNQAPSVFCFPNKKAMREALQVEQYGLDLTGENFLVDLHVVLEQLMQWPPAWSLVVDLLDTKEAWSKPYCDKIVSSPWWKALPLLRKSFIVPRLTLRQLEKDAPHVAAGMTKWLDMLRLSGNAKTQQLLQEFKDNDDADVKAKRCTARPLMRLMQYAHSRAVQQLLGVACKGSEPALAKFKEPQMHGLSILHHVVSLGDAPAAKAILKALPKQQRSQFAMRRDNFGYTAMDWAKLADFPDVVEVLEPYMDKGETSKAEWEAVVQNPVSAFPAAIAEEEDQCSADGSDCISGDRGSGGWHEPNNGLVPQSWLPAAGSGCDFDSVEAKRFDIDVFYKHYLLHPRPLLIKNGLQLSRAALSNFSKASLLAEAGDRKVMPLRYATEKDFDGGKPQVKPLAEYIEGLEQRRPGAPPKKLQIVNERLNPEEQYLNFSAALPKLFDGQVDHTGTDFFLGGALTGSAPNHRAPNLLSVAYGRLLWQLQPPGNEVVVHEPLYDILAASDGLSGSKRCLQEAGDVLFVPRSWTQSWLCLGDCVGMLHDISHNMWDLRD